MERYDKRLSMHFNYHRFIRQCREFHRASGKDPVAAILVHQPQTDYDRSAIGTFLGCDPLTIGSFGLYAADSRKCIDLGRSRWRDLFVFFPVDSHGCPPGVCDAPHY